MKKVEIVRTVNRLLAGETLSFDELRIHLDNVIDTINTELNAKFPIFSDLPLEQIDYDYFPDRYLRTVVCMGAAINFFITDEEGGSAPQSYAQMFDQALFNMKRDYIQHVPVEYDDNFENAVVPVTVDTDLPVRPGDFLL